VVAVLVAAAHPLLLSNIAWGILVAAWGVLAFFAFRNEDPNAQGSDAGRMKVIMLKAAAPLAFLFGVFLVVEGILGKHWV